MKRKIQSHLFQALEFGESPEVGEGGVAEVDGLQVGEGVGEALDVPPGLHSAQVQLTNLQVGQNRQYSED